MWVNKLISFSEGELQLQEERNLTVRISLCLLPVRTMAVQPALATLPFTELPRRNYWGCNFKILAISCCMFFVSIFAPDRSEPHVLVSVFTSR